MLGENKRALTATDDEAEEMNGRDAMKRIAASLPNTTVILD